MIGLTGTGAGRRLRIGALIAALALAATGLTLAGLAGAENQPSARQGAYPNPCDPGKFVVAKITDHPRKRTTKKSAEFKFKAFFCNSTTEVPNAEFKCKLDGRNYRKCTSPKRYRHLHRGRHLFKVKAIANQSSDTASFRWRIKRG
jgi:hypothetical protein